MKCVCPKCKNEFIQTNKDNILKCIKENPGISLTDIHWEVRISVKNVMINVNKLEEKKLIKVVRRKGKRKISCYDVDFAILGDAE
jgi:predicted transcriptional regulator